MAEENVIFNFPRQFTPNNHFVSIVRCVINTTNDIMSVYHCFDSFDLNTAKLTTVKVIGWEKLFFDINWEFMIVG